MPTEAKEQEVAELREVIAGSATTIVADYRGLTVRDITTVRRSLRSQGIGYRVVKNRLARIAADQAGVSELGPLLEGPSVIATGGTDESALARGLLDALRPFRTITVRGAVVRGRRLDSSEVGRLATLPGREVLLGQLAGGIVAPLATMASLLSAPLRNLGYALQQVADQKAAAAPAEAPPAAEAPAPEAQPEAPAAEAQPEAPAPEAQTTNEPAAEASAAEAQAMNEPAAEPHAAEAQPEAAPRPQAQATPEADPVADVAPNPESEPAPQAEPTPEP
ncbi:MAG: 50S ribosomal protein L10 [Candidatus Limnocylindrales bacterium]